MYRSESFSGQLFAHFRYLFAVFSGPIPNTRRHLCTAQNKGYNEQLRNEWKLKTLESIKNFVDEI